MKSSRLKAYSLAGAAFAVIFSPARASAMHITEGILPMEWAAFWYVVAAPFVWLGLRELRIRSEKSMQFKPLLGLVGSAVFIISCMPVPIPAVGATSHPCGVGLAAILIGPHLTALVSSVALALQALFMAHGGVTTLGANVVSMGVIGALAGYAAFRLSIKIGLSGYVAAFLAGLIADWATYAGTSFFLAAALHGEASLLTMFLGIMAAFVPTQLPLGIMEGFLTAGAYEYLRRRKPELVPATGGGRAQ